MSEQEYRINLNHLNVTITLFSVLSKANSQTIDTSTDPSMP